MKQAPQNLLVGQAGVWRVAAELARRGVNPLFPGVDHGYDLSTDGHCRIQVKSAGLRKNRSTPKGAYWFKFWQSSIVSGRNNIRHRGARDYSLCADVVVLWGMTEDRFWVLPTTAISTTQCLLLGPSGFYQRAQFHEARRLRAEGLSQQEIADKLGITQAAVSYQLRGGRSKLPKETMTTKARQHEDRWDLIVEFGKDPAGVEPAGIPSV